MDPDDPTVDVRLRWLQDDMNALCHELVATRAILEVTIDLLQRVLFEGDAGEPLRETLSGGIPAARREARQRLERVRLHYEHSSDESWNDPKWDDAPIVLH